MKRTLFAAFAGIVGALSLPAPALAQDSPWMVRGRVIGVLPDAGGDLSVGETELMGDVDIDDQVVPELDITYFFTDNIAAELILAVTPHDVSATGVTVPGALDNADIDLGDVWLLPPTLTLQYHFNNRTRFTPYIGAGINVTFFFAADEGPVADDIDYDPAVAFALQGGFDFDFDGKPGGWAFNADVKKIFLNKDVEVDFTTALGAVVDADVAIEPLIVGVGLGYRF